MSDIIDLKNRFEKYLGILSKKTVYTYRDSEFKLSSTEVQLLIDYINSKGE